MGTKCKHSWFIPSVCMSISFQHACFSACMKTAVLLSWKWEIVRVNGMMNLRCLKSFSQSRLSERVIVLCVGGIRGGSDLCPCLKPFSGLKMMSMIQIAFVYLASPNLLEVSTHACVCGVDPGFGVVHTARAAQVCPFPTYRNIWIWKQHQTLGKILPPVGGKHTQRHMGIRICCPTPSMRAGWETSAVSWVLGDPSEAGKCLLHRELVPHLSAKVCI